VHRVTRDQAERERLEEEARTRMQATPAFGRSLMTGLKLTF
jgi:hypothetical protein